MYDIKFYVALLVLALRGDDEELFMSSTVATASEGVFHGAFFEKFLLITHYQTVLALVALGFGFYLVRLTHKRFEGHSSSFSIRMLTGMAIGAVLGLAMQAVEGFPAEKTVLLTESSKWYGLFGRSFISLIRMLVIPIVFVSIVKVVIDFANEKSLSKIAVRGVFWLLFTTGVAAVVGILLGSLIGLGDVGSVVQGGATIREQTNLVDTLVNLVPNNIVGAMNGNNVVGLVIFSAFVGMATVVVERTYPESVAVFKGFIDGFHKIVMQMTRFVISLMPYAVIALLAGTIMSNGIPAIVEVSSFVLALYLATLIMLVIHVLLVLVHGLSPVQFLRKSVDVWLMAFSSRSSMGTLPLTISTLTDRMGVYRGTANLVPSLGATMGMNGCAGVFPALLVMMVAQMIGLEMNLQFYVMLVIVVVIGSIGVAGIPGTATIAATIVLSGMGLGEYFYLIGMVLAIDPILDMARTLANVSGAMVAAIVTDKEVGTLDVQVYNDPEVVVVQS